MGNTNVSYGQNHFSVQICDRDPDGVQLIVTYSAKMHMSQILDEKYVIKLWLQEKRWNVYAENVGPE